MILVMMWERVMYFCLGKYLYFSAQFMASAPFLVSTVAWYDVPQYALAHLSEMCKESKQIEYSQIVHVFITFDMLSHVLVTHCQTFALVFHRFECCSASTAC